MTADPDPAGLLDALRPEDREAVRRRSRLIGLGDRWHACPPLRNLVEIIAVLTASDKLRAEDQTLTDRGGFLLAAEILLGDDNPDRPTCAGDILAKRLRRWLGGDKMSNAAPAGYVSSMRKEFRK